MLFSILSLRLRIRLVCVWKLTRGPDLEVSSWRDFEVSIRRNRSEEVSEMKWESGEDISEGIKRFLWGSVKGILMD